jgi:hypothetical protein
MLDENEFFFPYRPRAVFCYHEDHCLILNVGDTGRGCGASHQTVWTAVIALILVDLGEHNKEDHEPTGN